MFQPATAQTQCRNTLIACVIVAITDCQLLRRARATYDAPLFYQVGGVGGFNLFVGEHRGERRLFDAPDRVQGWLTLCALARGGARWRLTHGKALRCEQAPSPISDGMSGG
ncbi:hypothetical protein XVE_4317 [Xanthomonas vesicatoria ATCC 35937]|uniref:Uncharacterized protein n=1 Tax=Xanthomonas vesicatoria ATCC 35937 TaxID=925775 RepID=F0BJ59_9XANT|nr:hypothetical protein XVE_4317 [Xanthomonas vesicatoria ATCC 35937]KTF35307.1 hypothetical protein LMG920_03320 [Xanthomonas vesicatoria]